MRRSARHLQFGSVKRIIALPILVVFAQARAHFQPQLRGHCHVPSIEQAVEICPEQQPVAYIVRTLLSVRADVGSLKGWKRTLSRHRAGPTVCIENGYAECCLPKPGLYQTRFAIARAKLYGQR